MIEGKRGGSGRRPASRPCSPDRASPRCRDAPELADAKRAAPQAKASPASSREEVLALESPARYIVGALYPVLRPDEEQKLDEAAQAPAVTDVGEDEAEVAPQPAEPAPDIDIADIDEELVADTPFDRPGRPSSCGMSFVVASSEACLTLTVSGGRYEPFPLVIMGADRTAWHRIPVHAQLEVQLPADGSKAHRVENVVVEPLRLEEAFMPGPPSTVAVSRPATSSTGPRPAHSCPSVCCSRPPSPPTSRPGPCATTRTVTPTRCCGGAG